MVFPIGQNSSLSTSGLRACYILTTQSASLFTHAHTCVCPHTYTSSTASTGRCSQLLHPFLPVTGRESFQTIGKGEKEMYIWNMVYAPEAEIRREYCGSRRADLGNFMKSSCARLVVHYPITFRIPNKVLHLLMSILMTL